MTKIQLREKYLEWNRNNGYKCSQRNSVIFEQMKQLSNKNGFKMWCSMDMLLKDLVTTPDCDLALKLYAEYHQNLGRQESLQQLAISTNNFEIKK